MSSSAFYSRFGYLDPIQEELDDLNSMSHITNHNDLSNNGGANSHAAISVHMAANNAHGTTSNIVGINDVQTVTNKTLNSSNNTVQVSGTNINSLINQDVRTTASPDFTSLSLNPTGTNTGLIITSPPGAFGGLVMDSSGSSYIDIRSNGNPALQIGVNPNTGIAYIDSITGGNYLSISTADSERIRILGSGISNDNTVTNILGLNNTTLSYKNNIIDTTSSQSLSSKNIVVPSCKLVDNSDVTKAITFNAAGATTATTLTLTDVSTANRAITFPDATTTLVGRDTTDTLSNKTLNSANIVAPLIRSGAAESPLTFNTTGLTAMRTYRFPDTSGTPFVVLASGTGQTISQVLSFSTAPEISTITNTGTLTLPTSTDTIVGRATTDTLTNKTLNSASNTITITASPLSAVNVNSLINQDVRTSATPTFSGAIINTNGLEVTGAKSGSYSAAGVYMGTTGGDAGIEIVTNAASYIDFATIGVDSSARIVYDAANTRILIQITGAPGTPQIIDAAGVTTFPDQIRISSATTPASSSAAGTTGSFAWDSTYFYICIASNTWHRVAHATF